MMSVLSRCGVLVILRTVQERSSWAETRWTSELLALHRHGEVPVGWLENWHGLDQYNARSSVHEQTKTVIKQSIP